MNYDGLSYDEILDVAEELIDKGDLHEAKAALDAAAEESGRKYFIKSKFYKNKGWYNEERKCLKKALKGLAECCCYCVCTGICEGIGDGC